MYSSGRLTLVIIALAAVLALAAPAKADSFSGTNPLSIPITWDDLSSSNINVSGLAGTITNVSVDLYWLDHSIPDDIEVVLQGPDGTWLVLLADQGDNIGANHLDISFSDSAANVAPDSGALSSTTYRPLGSAAGLDMPHPSGTMANTFSGFDGLDPNGSWALLAFDDLWLMDGSIQHGWRLNLTTSNGDDSVPEPGTMLLFGSAAGLVGWIRRRRRG